MTDNYERPPKNTVLPWENDGIRGVNMFFDDPDFVAAETGPDEDGSRELTVMTWAVKPMGARAVLFALQDVLVQGG